METNYRIALFGELGRTLRRQLSNGELEPVVARAVAANEWFTPQSVAAAVDAVCCDLLAPETLRKWLDGYPRPEHFTPRDVGVVMAGNIPLVGFFDLLCVCITGHRCLLKPSSKDRVLMDYVVGLLHRLAPDTSIRPLGPDACPDALIATGGDQARDYFARRYAGIPSLLRGSRHSIAVLDGTETDEQLQGLSGDVFLYFGLGCRNVSRIFVPRGYDLLRLRDALACFPVSHPGYLNNYRQARALRVLSGEQFLDGGFFLLCGGDGNSGALTEVRYMFYDDLATVENWIGTNDDRLQCIVSEAVRHPRRVGFGRAQHPGPADYPDGIDVIDFLYRI